MKTTRTLMLATVAALSLGAGVAMAQESGGGYIAGPNEQRELLAQSRDYGAQVARAMGAPTSTTTQYGSSDRPSTSVSNWPALQGGDGSGG
jgi:hypothetical protein